MTRHSHHVAFTTLHLACVVMQRDRYFEHFAFTTLHLACVVMQGRMELPFRPPHFYVSDQLARLLASDSLKTLTTRHSKADLSKLNVAVV
jgi:hypothetical protein